MQFLPEPFQHDNLCCINQHVRKLIFFGSTIFIADMEQQNHRLSEVRRGQWRSSCSTLCAKQDQLQQVAQEHTQLDSECLPGRRPQSLSAQCVLAFNHSHSQTVFLIHKWHFLYFNFCPLFFILSLDTIETWLSLLYSFSPSGTFNIARILMFPSRIVSAISAYPCILDVLIPSPKQLHGIFLGSFHYFVSCTEAPRTGHSKLK